MLNSVKILKKTVNSQNKEVYDIEVDNANHYILDNGVVSHNSAFIFASSIVIAMKKGKLKEDEDGNKVTNVNGIRSMIMVRKTRFNKPFEKVEVKIPWKGGIDPYSGLVELFENRDILIKDGNKLRYVDNDGVEHKYFRKFFGTEKGHELLDKIMNEQMSKLDVRNKDGINDLKEEFVESNESETEE